MEAEFDILYGEGISKLGDLLDMGVGAAIIDKSGSWFSYEGERIGQGRKNVVNFLNENPDIHKSVSVKVQEALGLIKKKQESVSDK